MERKQYKRPSSNIVCINQMSIICTSDVTSGIGIGFGGTDETGNIEPSSRKQVFPWDTSFDEE